MLSRTLKRSVAAVGVAAGLLAAAGPASAQTGPSTNGLTTPRTGPAPQTVHANPRALALRHHARLRGPARRDVFVKRAAATQGTAGVNITLDRYDHLLPGSARIAPGLLNEFLRSSWHDWNGHRA